MADSFDLFVVLDYRQFDNTATGRLCNKRPFQYYTDMKLVDGINGACLGINGQHAHIDGCDGTKTSSCMRYRDEYHKKIDSWRLTAMRIGKEWGWSDLLKNMSPFVKKQFILNGGTQEQLDKLVTEARAQCAVAAPKSETKFFSFDTLRTVRKRNKTGRKGHERSLVINPEQAKKEREARGLMILNAKWPAPDFTVVDNTTGIQEGSDYAVFFTGTETLVARIDVKSSNVLTIAQYTEAMRLFALGIPYWIMNPDDGWKIQITPDTPKETASYKVWAE